MKLTTLPERIVIMSPVIPVKIAGEMDDSMMNLDGQELYCQWRDGCAARPVN
jgi:hypothetical protein